MVAPEAHEAVTHGRHVHVHLAAILAGARVQPQRAAVAELPAEVGIVDDGEVPAAAPSLALAAATAALAAAAAATAAAAACRLGVGVGGGVVVDVPHVLRTVAREAGELHLLRVMVGERVVRVRVRVTRRVAGELHLVGVRVKGEGEGAGCGCGSG